MSRLEKLEQMLQAEPEDVFLHYALAKELISTGQTQIGLDRLEDINGRWPDYVPAFFERGRSLADAGQTDAAKTVIATGIKVAERVGDDHARGEMAEFLSLLSD